MTRLSVNVNKVALLRNSRNVGIPSVLRAAELSIAAGAHGITVHPRPDQRHIRPADVHELASLLRRFPEVELNIEGNPFPEFLTLVESVRPTQCTLVPDSVDAATSDHGWNVEEERERLASAISTIRALGSRVSLFMDAESDQWRLARSLGADRVELYTEPYAAAHARGQGATALPRFAAAARMAQAAGLGVNAGHDLNLQNLGEFCRIPDILEVSIGHALVADALEMGLPAAVRAYLLVLAGSAGDVAPRPLPVPKVSRMGYNPANFAHHMGTGPWVNGYSVYYAISFYDRTTLRESARSKWWGPKTDPKKLYGGFGLIRIPIDPTGQATARRIWRKFEGEPEKLVGEIPDNVTTKYQDGAL